MGRGEYHPFTGMTKRETLFVHMAARSLVRSMMGHLPLMKEAGMEAKEYYNPKSPRRMYWEGWNDAIDSTVSMSENDITQLILGMGGNKKAVYIANAVAQGIKDYEDHVAGKTKKLRITTDSFKVFR